MVKPEEYSQQKRKWNGEENLPNIDIPEVDQPFPVKGWKESFAGGQCGDLDTLHVANVNKPSEEDNRQRRAIVFDEFPDISLEETASTEFSADPTAHQNQESDHNAQIGRCLSNLSPLPGQDLDALLKIDEGNVEPKDITRKAGNVGQRITGIRNGKQPMHDQRPAAGSLAGAGNSSRVDLHSNPAHEGKVVRTPRGHNIIHRVVEDGDWAWT